MSERKRGQHRRYAVNQFALLTFVALVGAMGCSGNAGSGPGVGPGPGNGGQNGNGGSGMGGTNMPPVPGEFTPSPGGLRRLTALQYRNSIADLFGGAVTVTSDLEPDTSLSGFASIGAARISLSGHVVEQFETSALDLAKQALTDPTKRAAFVGCNPTAATDDNCTQAFIKKFGRRAWRRPLADDEVTAYSNLTKSIQTSLKTYFGGLEYGLAAILQSPHFIYREEFGAPDPAKPSRMIFNDYELATRLSYFLWNTTPDDALLDAADAKQLSDAKGFAAQVDRLLKSPRAAAGVQTFFSEYYRLGDLDNLPQLPTVYPQRTTTLGPAMREETMRFLADIAITRDGDFRDMFDSPTTFVNAELAKLYGLPPVSGTDFVKATLPDNGIRAGYLGQGSFLALNAHSNTTSPTLRGKFIREMLMCQTVPPPPNAVPPLPMDTGTAMKTMRQKLEIHRLVEPCKTCHSIMDPLGLAFENFDGIGAYRTMEVGQTIDATGDLDGVKFNGPRELAKLLRGNPAVLTCVARNLYRYVTGHIEDTGEEPAITQLAKGFEDGKFHFSALVGGMVQSAGFVYAAPPSNDPLPGGGSGGAGGGGSGGAGVDAGPVDSGRPDAGSMDVGMVPTGPLSYAKHIAPIIAAKCTPCHTTQAMAGFNFTYDNLVTNSAVTNTITKPCDFLNPQPKRIAAGDPDHSLLWIKVSSDNVALASHMCGEHMPQLKSGIVLSTVELDTIHNWIRDGAKP